MSVEQNKAALKRLYDEVWNKGNLSVIPELVSPNYHYGDYKGLDGYRQLVAMQRAAFPDVRFTVDHGGCEGDWLAYQVSTKGTLKAKLGNIEPTGRTADWKRAFFSQFQGGKIVTAATVSDSLGFYQQIGVKPPGFEESAEQNKALIRKMYDLWNRKQTDAALDLMAPSYVGHFTDAELTWEQEAKLDVAYIAAFPDASATIEDLVAEGDKVAIRVTWRGTHQKEYMGIAPTGKQAEMTNAGVFRIAGGKVVELWATMDNLRFLRQLGAIPPAK